MWPRSDPGALTVKLIPQTETSARIKAPDEKLTWSHDKGESFCKHEAQRPLLVLTNPHPGWQLTVILRPW